MEQHCIISKNTLLAKGLQHYLKTKRKAIVSLLSTKDFQGIDAYAFPDVQYVWIDAMHEMDVLLKLPQHLKNQEPRPKVFVFGEFRDSKNIQAIFKTGVTGYFLTNCGVKQIKEAILEADSGKTYLDPQLTKVFVEDLLQPKALRDPKPKLTKRERQILQLIIEEHTTQEIANKLFISLCTVETHRIHLIQKIGVRNTAGLVREALEANLLG